MCGHILSSCFPYSGAERVQRVSWVNCVDRRIRVATLDRGGEMARVRLVLEKNVDKVPEGEVGPQDREKGKVCVGTLPQQKVGQTDLARRPDDDVDVVFDPKRGGKNTRVQIIRVEDALWHSIGGPRCRGGDFVGRSVGEAHIE